jgi:hypothetical protein
MQGLQMRKKDFPIGARPPKADKSVTRAKSQLVFNEQKWFPAKQHL